MLKTVAITTILLLFTASGLSPPERLAAHEALQQATSAQDHARVLELTQTLSLTQPEDAQLWYLMGRSAFARNDHELSIKASEKAWTLGYRYMPWIALRLARSSAALGRDEDALAWLERALAAGLEDRARLAGYPEFERLADDPRLKSLAGARAPQGRAEGLKADIDFLVTEARRLHPAWDEVSTRFETAAARLRQRAPDLDDRQFLFDTMRLVTLLGDGHSWVSGPSEGSPLEIPSPTLPVLFYLFEEGLYVVDGKGPGAELIGRRVQRIGRRTPEELLDHSRTLHGAENAMTMRWLGVHFYFPSATFLLDAGAIDDPSEARLELATGDGGSGSVVLPTGDHQFQRKLRPPKVGSVEAPRYLQRVDDNYWFEPLDERTIYFQFNQVRDSEDEPIEAFAFRLGDALSKSAVANLVVDVRHNNGGNNGLLRPLLRQIVAFDTRPEGRVFVVTGRNTFSAAQNFINRIEQLTDAVFVGEPSSSSPNFIGEETEVILPWSRVRASISSRKWQDSDPGDARPWIAPHIPVPPRAADYFAGKDAALEAIGEIISPGEG